MPYIVDANGAILQDENGNDLYSGITILRDGYTFSVEENRTAVGTLEYVNDNPSGVAAFSIVGGDDQALFSVHATTGVLSFLSPPDFEAPADADSDNVYEVVVRLTDTNNSVIDDELILVTVSNVGEALLVSPIASSSICIGIGI